MKITRTKLAALLAASPLVLLGACGSDEAPAASDKPTQTAAGADGGELPEITSTLDIFARSIASIMRQKIEDYEVDGNTVRFKIKSGITLAGSECVIIDSATQGDHPDATFILVNGGEEITC